MAHNKVYGFCESKCKVEVPTKEQYEEKATDLENLIKKVTDLENQTKVYFCSTERTNNQKQITISGFTQTIGSIVKVCFQNGNFPSDPTLNVNGLGAKPIVTEKGLPLDELHGGSQSGACYWDNNTFLELWYDGTNWVVIGDPIVSKFSYMAPSYMHSALCVAHISGKRRVSGTSTTLTPLAAGATYTHEIFTDSDEVKNYLKPTYSSTLRFTCTEVSGLECSVDTTYVSGSGKHFISLTVKNTTSSTIDNHSVDFVLEWH